MFIWIIGRHYWLVFSDIAVVTGIGLKTVLNKKMKLTDIGPLLVFPGLGTVLFQEILDI